MSSDSHLEEIRGRLDIDKLDAKERVEMFSKFQKAGGQIIDVKKQFEKNSNEIQKASHEYKRKQSFIQSVTNNKSHENHKIRGVQQVNPFDASVAPIKSIKNSKPKLTQEEAAAQAKAPRSIKFFWLRFSCFLAGITDFSARRFSGRFGKNLAKSIPQSVAVLRAIFGVIFSSKTKEAVEFREKYFEADKYVDYEMAYHIYQLIDISLLNDLMNIAGRPIDKLEEIFKNLFRPLYFYNRYSSQLKISGTMVFRDIKLAFPEVKLPSESAYEKAWNTIWVSLYFDLYQLMEYFLVKHNRKHAYKTMDEYLETDNIQSLGVLANEWKDLYLAEKSKKEEFIAKTKEEGGITKSVFPNEYIEHAVSHLLHAVPFQTLYTKFKASKELRSLLTYDDKLFYVYTILDYFDSEYNLLWVGNLINFYTIADGGHVGRFDTKKELVRINGKITSTYDMINDYLRSLSNSKKIQAKVVNQQNTKELTDISYNTRRHFEKSIFEMIQLLDRIFKTKGTREPLVGNWDDILVLSKSFQEKVVHKMSVVNALKSAHQFLAASVWLLKQGDLSGMSKEVLSPIVLDNVIALLQNLNTD